MAAATDDGDPLVCDSGTGHRHPLLFLGCETIPAGEVAREGAPAWLALPTRGRPPGEAVFPERLERAAPLTFAGGGEPRLHRLGEVPVHLHVLRRQRLPLGKSLVETLKQTAMRRSHIGNRAIAVQTSSARAVKICSIMRLVAPIKLAGLAALSDDTEKSCLGGCATIASIISRRYKPLVLIIRIKLKGTPGRPKSARSIDMVLSVLRLILSHARAQGLIDTNAVES